MPYNKGDFTEQGVAGDVTALVRLNEKRTVKLTLSSDDASDNCDISGSVIDELNDKTYPIGSGVSGNIEITENGENINVAPYATATVNVSGGGGGGNLTTATLKVVVPEGVQSNYIMGCFVMPAVPEQTPDTSFYQSSPYITGDNEYQVILYKGGAVLVISQTVRSLSGDITSIGGDSYFMTGDCTVTLANGGGN